MTVTEFIKGRNVDGQAVRKYIARHPEIFKGLTGKKGREITLTPDAIELLDKKYPFLKPVEVINGVDPIEHIRVQNELSKAKDTIRAMEEVSGRLKIDLSNAQADLFLLEQKQEAELAAKDIEIQKRELENKELQLRLNKAEEQLARPLTWKERWTGKRVSS